MEAGHPEAVRHEARRGALHRHEGHYFLDRDHSAYVDQWDWERVITPDQRHLAFLKLPYHQAILDDEIPLSIGGVIGQSRTYVALPRKGHLGEVSVTVWPKIHKICATGRAFTCSSRVPQAATGAADVLQCRPRRPSRGRSL